MSNSAKLLIDFEQMMNEGLKQFDARRESVDWLSNVACKKLIKDVSQVIKCSPETAQSSMYIYIFLFG